MDNYKVMVMLAGISFSLRKARREGEINFRNVYTLNCVRNVIKYACNLGISESELRELNIIYFNLYSKFKDVPKVDREDIYIKKTKIERLIVQSSIDKGMNAPTVDDYTL